MKLLSRLLLPILRRLPRGYFRITRRLANYDPSLQDIVLPLSGLSRTLRGDLRESVFIPLWRLGRIPHQHGLDHIMRSLVRPGDTIFDIGANVGYTVLLLADLAGPDGRVVALEPGPRAHELLQRSLRGIPEIEILNQGVSRENGTMTFYVPDRLDTASLQPIESAQTVTVDTITIDKLAERFGQPALIKIDIEGHEPAAFEGARHVMSDPARPVILFEALGRAQLAACRAVLPEGPQGYRIMRIQEDGALADPASTEGSSDYIALPPWANDRMEAAAS